MLYNKVSNTGALSAGGCNTKHSWKELPYVRGEGQKPGRPHAQRATARRSHPTSEAVMAQEWLKRVTPLLRSGAAAGRSYPATEARGSGWEEPPRVRGRGGREEPPHIQGEVAVRAQQGLEEPSHVKGQEGRQRGDTHVLGKNQQRCFAGAAVKRYSTNY